MSNMARKPEINISAEEWDRIVQSAAPPTPDDCTVLHDGTRLDTKEKILAYFEDLANEREFDEPSGIAL
jgi:hypothetical protein